MKRRDFIRKAALASLAAGGAVNPVFARTALGQSCPLSDMPRSLVNVMLQGGADFRFLLMPAPNHPDNGYLNAIWAARRSLYSSDYANYEQMFDNEYLLATDPRSGQQFGVFNQAAWLHGEFQAGRVAVVANAVCSSNRRHDQSILNADAGVPGLDQLNFDRDGWGGRFVEQVAGQPNAVELGSSVSVLTKGTTSGARLDRVVHAEDMRNMSLAAVNPELPQGSRRNALARALHGWYEARAAETAEQMPPQWPYHVYFKHRAVLQEFGGKVDERIALCGDLPAELQELVLSNEGFAQQCRNLYDACQMPDVLNQRVMSMDYGGWDTHDNEYAEFSLNIADLFGEYGGLATTVPMLSHIPSVAAPVNEQLLFYFASDFGRQLRANGTAGTDHGSGTYSLLMGESVRGGVYGEMFPEGETQPNEYGQVPLETGGADISGRTSTERILTRACDWCESGTGSSVFPGAAGSVIESPGLLDEILRA